MEGLNAPPEVVVLGNAGVDTNAYLPGRDVDWSVEANFIENLETPGQAGVYASRGCAALGGRRVAFIGNLGDDAAAPWCGRRSPAMASMSAACSRIPPAPPGVST
jgi:sugar/nucleoside kinase (ribokinase family)